MQWTVKQAESTGCKMTVYDSSYRTNRRVFLVVAAD